jgi:hypothetical protein
MKPACDLMSGAKGNPQMAPSTMTQATTSSDGARLAGQRVAVVLLGAGRSVNEARLALVNDLGLSDEQSLAAIEAALRTPKG